jgi:hypothetical protein
VASVQGESGEQSRNAPIVIRGSVTHAVHPWYVAGFAVLLLLLLIVMVSDRDGKTLIPGSGLLLFFGLGFLYAETVRVELNGDEIAYGHAFKQRQSLRLEQIKSAKGVVKSAGTRFPTPYLVIEPIDPQIPMMKIRTGFFSHADVQKIRNFLGAKLKRYTKRKT